jgi:hypothetical protein
MFDPYFWIGIAIIAGFAFWMLRQAEKQEKGGRKK